MNPSTARFAATGSRRIAARNWALMLALAAGLYALAACNTTPQSPAQQEQQLKEQAAKTTEEVKQGAKQAATEGKVAAADAERKLDAIAAGVKEGIHDGSASDKPGAGRVDLNSASEDDLTALPGISHSRARAIIDGRPYNSSHQLVTRRLLTEAQYERISSRVTAR
jgi:DNA uptake protein ComE-like DNA-binding protein